MSSSSSSSSVSSSSPSSSVAHYGWSADARAHARGHRVRACLIVPVSSTSQPWLNCAGWHWSCCAQRCPQSGRPGLTPQARRIEPMPMPRRQPPRPRRQGPRPRRQLPRRWAFSRYCAEQKRRLSGLPLISPPGRLPRLPCERGCYGALLRPRQLNVPMLKSLPRARLHLRRHGRGIGRHRALVRQPPPPCSHCRHHQLRSPTSLSSHCHQRHPRRRSRRPCHPRTSRRPCHGHPSRGRPCRRRHPSRRRNCQRPCQADSWCSGSGCVGFL